MIDLFLVTPVWVINCVLLFNPPQSLPTAFIFYSISWFLFFILSGLSDAVVMSWLVKHQSFFFFFLFLMLRLSWLMLHLWWVLFCFCFVLQIWDCCAERKIIGCVSLFFLKSQQLFYQSIDLWHRARKWFNSVFFSLIFIYWSFVWVFFFLFLVLFCFHVYCFFVEGKQDST